MQDVKIDIEKSAKNLHTKMEQVLKPAEWKVYKLLYIDHRDEEQVAASRVIKQMKKIVRQDINKYRILKNQ